MKPYILTLIVPVLLLGNYASAYDARDYNPDYLPYNYDQAVDYSHYKDCARDLDNFDEEYSETEELLSSFLEDGQTTDGYFYTKYLPQYEATKVKFEAQFKDCVDRAEKNGYESQSETETEKGIEYEDDMGDLEEVIEEQAAEIKALKAQIEQLLTMVKMMMALNLAS